MTPGLEALEALPAGERTYIERQDGTRLHCLDGGGSGPTVVLAHGFMGSISGYNLVWARLLEQGFRVVGFDQRGHGESTAGTDGIASKPMAEDYRAVLDHFGIEGGVLVGHSMGAFLSALFCIQHPSTAKARLQGMVLIGGHAGDVARGSFQNKLQLPMMRAPMVYLMRTRWMTRLLVRSFFGDAPDEAFVEATVRQLLRTSLAVLPILRAMTEENHYPSLSQIAVKTTVICGEKDQTCPHWHSERLGKEIPDARNIWLSKVGHIVTYEDPGSIVDAVKALGSAGS